MKKVYILVLGLAWGFAGFSQTPQTKVEKQARDAQRKADAGKADVISANKKNVFDSTTFNNSSTEAINHKTAKRSAKKKNCGKKASKGKAKSVAPKRALK